MRDGEFRQCCAVDTADSLIRRRDDPMAMMEKTRFFGRIVRMAAVASALGLLALVPLPAQISPPQFEVDPSWPKPLPDLWVTGAVGGVCTDAQDHVFILNRGGLTENELDSGRQAPAVIEFDTAGNVVNSWGNRDILPEALHGCFVDRENNIWLSGSGGGVVQKYTHDGGKLLLQIGTSGMVDSSNGTVGGLALNSSHAGFFRPSAVAVDPGNGDVYVADGEEPGSNHRVAVFDRNGHFLRQWLLQSAISGADAADGSDTSMQVPHCVTLGNDGLVYVCDRRGDGVQVFDKMGKFQKSIAIPYEPHGRYRPGPGHVPRAWGTAVWIGFSPDREQSLMYVVNEDDERVDVLDRAGGKVLASFGRAGHQVGEFTFAHTLAVDSKGNIYVAELGGEEAGNRVQKFTKVGSR
jgi:DNA-binding beta-propeller fold protein YncE